MQSLRYSSAPLVPSRKPEKPPTEADPIGTFMRERSSMLRSLEKTFAVLMLLYTTGAILPFFTQHGSTTQANAFELAVQVPLYCLTFFFVMLHWRSFLSRP